MSEDRYDSINSLDDILRELDEEKIHIVISKDIRRFRKTARLVKGLQDAKDVESLTRELKMKVGTGGTYKDGQIVLQGDHRQYVKNFLLEKGFNENSIEVR